MVVDARIGHMVGYHLFWYIHIYICTLYILYLLWSISLWSLSQYGKGALYWQIYRHLTGGLVGFHKLCYFGCGSSRSLVSSFVFRSGWLFGAWACSDAYESQCVMNEKIEKEAFAAYGRKGGAGGGACSVHMTQVSAMMTVHRAWFLVCLFLMWDEYTGGHTS